MHTPVPDHLREVLDGRARRDDGAVASYIPELAAADPDVFGIAVTGSWFSDVGIPAVLHHLRQLAAAPTVVVIDLRRVDRFVDVGRRVVLDGMRRLALDGHRVVVVDPEGVLPDPDLGDGSYPEIRPATSEL